MTPGRPLAAGTEDPDTGAWLEPLGGHWVSAALAQLRRRNAVVRVTVVRLRGSAPREPGATLLVSGERTQGSIGGGRLEWQAIAAARALLVRPDPAPPVVEDIVLGPQLGQCCGGRVELWIERLTRTDLGWLQTAAQRAQDPLAADDLAGRRGIALATVSSGRDVSHRLVRPDHGNSLSLLRHDGRLTLLEPLAVRRPPLWIFGAGHVGQALVRLVSQVGMYDIHWIDARPELLPAGMPGVTRGIRGATAELLECPADARHVVLTHDHALDYDICRTILERGRFAWLGLIGSASKAARFRSRLARDGIAPGAIARLTCPIGVAGISSKLPAAIAIAVAAQLLRLGDMDDGRAAASAVDCSGRCDACGMREPAP